MIKISSIAYKFLILETCYKFPKETGGILMGYRKAKDLIVTEVVGPGPNAIHIETAFKPDDKFHEVEMARIYNASKGGITYLGDWHSHPNGRSFLSDKDRKTLKAIAFYPPSKLPEPIMLIVGLIPFQIRVWQFRITNSLNYGQIKEKKFVTW